MNTWNTLEQQLNSSIEKNGYRISPRLSLEDRLTRFIQMENGDRLSTEDARQAALLMMMKYSEAGPSSPSSNTTRSSSRRRVEETTDGNVRVTIQPRRSTRVSTASASATTTTPTTAATGTHSMVRRSHGRSA